MQRTRAADIRQMITHTRPPLTLHCAARDAHNSTPPPGSRKQQNKATQPAQAFTLSPASSPQSRASAPPRTRNARGRRRRRWSPAAARAASGPRRCPWPSAETGARISVGSGWVGVGWVEWVGAFGREGGEEQVTAAAAGRRGLLDAATPGPDAAGWPSGCAGAAAQSATQSHLPSEAQTRLIHNGVRHRRRRLRRRSRVRKVNAHHPLPALQHPIAKDAQRRASEHAAQDCEE